MAELAEEIKKLGTDLQANIEKASNEAKEAGKVSAETKSAVEAITQKLTDNASKQDEQQKHLDALDMQLKRGLGQGMSGTQSLKALLAEQFAKKEHMEAFVSSRFKKGFAIDLEEKAVGTTMSSGTNITGTLFVSPAVQPGVVFQPYNPTHVREFLSKGTTTSNQIGYIEDLGGNSNAAYVAEGGAKPQSDRNLTIKYAPVEKIAHYYRMPEEMIADIPYITSHITMIGLAELATVEDQVLLYNPGTTATIKGLTVAATPFAAGTLVVPTPNVYDVLVAAKLQIRKKQYQATAVLISPLDFAKLYLLKDTQGRYLFPEMQTGQAPRLAGVPIVENTAIVEGDFLIGDFVRGAQLFDRMQSRVQLFDQDQDNAIKNLVTIVIEERLAMPVYRPTAFVYGTFAAAILDLAS